MANKNVKIATIAILIVLTIVFTLVSNYIQIGTISINLSLIPILVSGILYAPFMAMFLGLISGGFIMLAPSTSAFFSLSVVGTILTCLLKSSIAGLVATFVYQLIIKKNTKIAYLTSGTTISILNTGLFILFSLIFFKSAFGKIISLFALINFGIEIVVTTLVMPLLSTPIEKRKSENL